jgi:hypothetical protein
MVRWLRDQSVTAKEAKQLSEAELAEKIVIGEFIDKVQPSLTERVQAIVKEAKKR